MGWILNIFIYFFLYTIRYPGSSKYLSNIPSGINPISTNTHTYSICMARQLYISLLFTLATMPLNKLPILNLYYLLPCQTVSLRVIFKLYVNSVVLISLVMAIKQLRNWNESILFHLRWMKLHKINGIWINLWWVWGGWAILFGELGRWGGIAWWCDLVVRRVGLKTFAEYDGEETRIWVWHSQRRLSAQGRDDDGFPV